MPGLLPVHVPPPGPPVVIAGGGVVGVTLALLLARRRVPTVVLEQALEPQRLPRAHAVNPRTIEILDAELGITADALRAVAAPKELTAEVRFVTTLTGHCFGTVPYERQDDDVLAVTPAPLLNVPQPDLEAILLDRVAAEPLVDLRRGHSWTGLEQGDGGVTSSVRTEDGTYELASRHLVGADGAGSGVREALGITMSGEEEVASAVSITFAADLRELVRTRPGVLHWLYGPPRRGTLIAHDPRRLWALSIKLPPGPRGHDAVPRRSRARAHPRGARAGRGRRRDRAARRHAVDDARAGRRRLPQRGRLPRRRCGAPLPAHRRPRAEHRRAGRPQPRLEARRRARRVGGGCAAGHLWRRARRGRDAQRPPEPDQLRRAGPAVGAGRGACRSPTPSGSRPGSREPGRAEADRGGDRAPARRTSTASRCSSGSPTTPATSRSTTSRASCRAPWPDGACRTGG